MGRLKRPTSLLFPRAFRVFRHCSGYVEQPKPLNTQGLSALFRVFNVLPARVTRERTTRAPAPYSFLPRMQGGNTWNTWNALYPCGIPRSGYPEQTRNTSRSAIHA